MAVLSSSLMRSVCLIVLFALLAPNAVAQTSFSFGLFAGSNEFKEEFGQETHGAATGGTAYATGVLLLTADLELDLIGREDPDSPYYFDSSVDRCRDSRTGRFADSNLCGGIAWGGAVTADANLIIPGANGLLAGVGYRLGSGSTPYVALGYAFGGYDGSGTRLEVQASRRLISLGVLFQLSG